MKTHLVKINSDALLTRRKTSLLVFKKLLGRNFEHYNALVCDISIWTFGNWLEFRNFYISIKMLGKSFADGLLMNSLLNKNRIEQIGVKNFVKVQHFV